MITRIFFFVWSLFIFSETAAQSGQDWGEIFAKLYQEVKTHSAAYKNLEWATQHIGHRLTGSQNGAAAEEYAYNLLRSYGLDVHYESFEAESWSRSTLSVFVNDEGYKAVSLAHSPVTATVSAQIIDMGNGLEEDYAKHPERVKGKIVLAYLGILPGSAAGLKNLHRSEKTALAIKYGAKGIILFNSAPGDILLTGTASVTGKLINIPAVCIGNRDGFRLKEELTKSSATAEIKMTNFSGTVKARNVVATIKGKEKAKEKIVIGGHLDSWDLATGATDNGIGAFAVIDIARTFKALNLKPKRTLTFVLFMGEEQGLLGSKAYVNKMMKEGRADEVRYMINLDMSNNPKGYIATTEADESLFKSIGHLAQVMDTSFRNTFNAGYGLHSDHQPFMLQGIPTAGVAGSLSRDVLNCYHADCDLLDLVNEEELKNTVLFTAMLLYGLADSSELNALRLGDDELKEALLKSNLKEPLTISGEWRWKD